MFGKCNEDVVSEEIIHSSSCKLVCKRSGLTIEFSENDDSKTKELILEKLCGICLDIFCKENNIEFENINGFTCGKNN